MVKKSTMWIAVIMIMAAIMALTGCPEADLSNVGATVSIESVSAPKITDTAIEGGLRLSWTAVKNARGYDVYRAEQNDKGKFTDFVYLNSVDAPANSYDDIVSLNENSIANKTYQYKVTAKTDKSTLSDNTGTTKAITVSGIKAKGEKVAAATNIKAEVVGNKLTVTFDALPDHVNAAKAEYRYTSVTGLPEAELNVLFPTTTMNKRNSTEFYKNSFATMVGKWTVTVTTSWEKGSYYADNTATAEFEVQSAGVACPGFYADDIANGISIQFTDYLGAEYTLYRAEEKEDQVYAFTAVASGTQWIKGTTNICEDARSYTPYYFVDETAERDKTYMYVLTGKIGDKALEYDEEEEYDNILGERVCVKQTASHWYGPTWTPNFQAYSSNDGTVDLSWTVEEGWTYSIQRCLVSDTDHTEDPVIVLADADVAGKINNVKVYVDHIEKTPDRTSYYKYTLIGTKDGYTRKTNSQSISPYYSAEYGFSFSASKDDGTTDVTITIMASSHYSEQFTFYRAEMKNDSGDYKYVTEFEQINLGAAVDVTTDAYGMKGVKMWHYKDTSAKTSGRAYRYAVKTATNGKDVYMIPYSDDPVTGF